MLSEIITRSKQYHSQLKMKASKRGEIIKQLIESPHFQSWMHLQQIIRTQVEQSQDMGLKKVIKETIEYSYRNVKSLPMMMFLYTLQVQGRVNIDCISWASWASLYQQFCIEQNELIIFNSWAFNPQNYIKIYDVIQNTLQMICKYFGRFLTQNKISFGDLEFDSIIQWVLRMRTQSPQKFQIAHSLSQVVHDVKIIKHSRDYLTKQPLILKKVFQNIGEGISDSGNAFLLLQPKQNYSEQTIDYFCHIYDYYLTDLNQDYLNNVFKNLTIGGITAPVLTVIEKISCLLANSQQYFKLRYIYQNFILPIFTKFKSSTFLGNEVYNRVDFYVLGFLKHCHIGKTGLDYLIEDIQLIKDKDLQDKWINLARTVAVANSLQDYVYESLVKKGLSNKKPIDYLPLDSSKVWNVTLRTGKKYKKYIKNESKEFKGMENRSNQCYIISVIQSLYFTQELQKLLDQYRENIRNKYPLLDQLRILMSQLAGTRDAKNITISYLKRCGPQEFRENKNQQDTMHYLMQLFEQIEKQCKQIPGMLQKFNQIFQIDCQHTTKCMNCSKQTTNIENTYIHTIPHTQLLQLKTEQKQLQGYTCEKCKQKGQCKNIRQINPKCKIFIVHINRFSIKDGVCKKQLSNQTILRRFLNYELVGMICHCGKNINSGHYKYFAKKGARLWVELSDRNVLRFQLEVDDEEFQREMQTDMSPYILFYKMVE